jgi:hypothetical protein
MQLTLREETAGREENASGHPGQKCFRSRPLLLMERTMYRDGRTPFTSVFSIKL